MTEFTLRVLREEELAQWLREKGCRVVFSHGRHWADHWGFCRLLHFAATIPADQLFRPRFTCWAFHALLTEDDAQRANTWYPLHLVRDLAAFDETVLESSARKQLRRNQAALTLIQVNDPELLKTQGWSIFSQNARRLGIDADVTKDRYLSGITSFVADSRRSIFGVMDGHRLLAYLETFAVGDTAYLDRIHLSDDSLSRHVSGFLHFEAAQIYRQSKLVTQLSAGPPIFNRPGISAFKKRWGIPIVKLPAYFWSPPPFRFVLKVIRPEAYYRATGIAPYELPQD